MKFVMISTSREIYFENHSLNCAVMHYSLEMAGNRPDVRFEVFTVVKILVEVF
jgi:hypothetical protein